MVAIESVLDVALHSSVMPARSRAICERQGVSLRYLETILQALVKGGILRSVRGPKGGYVLASDRRKITLEDIRSCIAANKDEVVICHSAALDQVADVVDKAISKTLSQVTIQDLYDRTMPESVENDGKDAGSFAI